MKKYISKLRSTVLLNISKLKMWFRRKLLEIQDLYSEENMVAYIAGIEDQETSKLLMLMLAEKMGAKITPVVEEVDPRASASGILNPRA
jgi:hypothetical protein